jgi:hypothetical protein
LQDGVRLSITRYLVAVWLPRPHCTSHSRLLFVSALLFFSVCLSRSSIRLLARCKTKSITKASCPKQGDSTYDKQHWAWLQREYPSKFEYWDTYERLRAFKWGLQKIGALESFTDLLGQHCDFTQMVTTTPSLTPSLPFLSVHRLRWVPWLWDSGRLLGLWDSGALAWSLLSWVRQAVGCAWPTLFGSLQYNRLACRSDSVCDPEPEQSEYPPGTC